ncbi:hypothetical protein LSTR_LSTR011476 [Laodelphax striatellus]|uniref:[histone H3]-trimethyl-L-lysine(4) demethylase n=1 Tax=Laodelphax striatellus TaxID=195883 RepID=A0A482WHM7_LAOST|nr:hypothetical protein LSTR_LSTR011476 [Laodelphax striatellus]
MQDGNSDDFFKRTCHGFCVNKRPRGIRYNYSFDRPPVAPTFYPTKEEFEDPTLYINNIRPLAEQYGLCKVVPPKDTFFPFTLDVANFKFPTRVQNLCRIDAAAKNKAIFLGRLKKFWEMRGKALKAPILDYQVLDLHYLHRTVMSEGGYAKVKRQNKWHTVSERMAYGNDSQIPARLEKYYEELLLPYVTLLEEENKGTDTASKPPPTQMSASDTMKAAEEETEMEEFAKSDSIYQLHRAKRMKLSQMEPIASTSRCSEEPETCDQSKIGELEKLYSVAIGEQSNVLESSKPETEISAKNLFKTPDLIIPKIVVTETTERGSKQPEKERASKPPEKASGSTQPEQESGPKPPEQASGSKQAEQESDHNPPEQASSSKQPDQESGPKPPEHVFKVPYPVSETRHGVTPRKSNELKRLQFHGAGPRIAVFTEPKSGKCGKRKRLKECCKCWKTNKLIDEILLDCYRCGDSYHLTCIVPKLNEIPRGNWHCNECIIKKLKTIPVEGLKAGFEDGKRLYTLAQFQKKADSFKEMYFDGQGKISKMRLENEFWYILSNDVEETVEYGADISGDNGTGFPTKECLKNVRPEFRERYKKLIDHPWNLNNLPVCDSSVLQFIDEPISGMKVPWMYIGMMFSTFCWHNEDHWCYSINFLHFGETKTWYSVPGDYAEEFENVVKEFAPELFEVHPDILHQLVTMINPNVLMERKIPVYRLDQEAGEFVITFPRAYHCGFNHGFNFAEAVNFAPPDWIAIGRRCVENYALSKRACVFSQDELIFKIAARYAAIDVRTCSAAYHDLYRAVHAEFAFREFFTSEWGGDNKECVVDFEFIPDDERQCEFCKTTVFMSGVSCQCDPIKVVCIRHYNKLCTVCKPKDHYLKIKHSAEHIFHIFQEMLKVVSPYEKWVRDVRNILRNNVPLEDGSTSFIGIDYLKDLVKVADRNNYPSTNLLKELIASVAEAEAINNTADRILSRIGSQQRPGEDIEDENDEDRPSFTELMNFIQSIDTKHLVYLKDDGILKYIRDVFEWKDRVKAVIASKCSDSKEMETLKKEGVRFNLDLPEIESLEGYIVRLKWREELADLFERHNELTKEILQEHKDKGLALNFEKDPEIEEGIIKIDELIDQINAWEEEAKNLIVVSRTKPTPESLRLLLDQGEEIKARLPSRKILENVLQSGLKWVDKVIAANSLKNGPYVDVYEDLLTQAHKINLELLLTDQILIQLDLVRIWREKVAATFLKSNGLTLMEALAPRNEILRSSKRKRDNYLSKNIIYGVKLSGDTDPGVVVAAFKRAEKLEFEQMLQLRLENSRKKIDSDAKYCICRKSEAGFMVECNLCKEKFHGPCLQMGIESDMAGSELADTKFLCSTCVRTKRPKLDILVELVQSMHMIKVRIPEGEALQRLTERAMNWQDRARKLLGTPEMTLALQKLYVPLPNIPRPTPRLQHPVNYERTPSSTVTSGMLAQASTSTSSSISHFAIDHGYSTVSRKTIPPKKHMRKSPLIPRVLEEPPRMSEAGFTQLKELMIQGDLMEVFVEEATCIWKLLQTFKQLYYSIWDEGYEDFVRHEAEKAKQEAAELKIEKGLSAIERFFQDKPPPPGSKKRTVNETPAPAKKTAKAPRKTSAKKTIATKPTKSKKPEPKQPKKKQKTSNATVRPAKRAKKSKQVDDDDDENDENSCEDDCAAEPCRRPTGTALHWVQCDGGCDLWFHLYCIGLNKEEIVADQDYVCEKCS